MALDIDHTAPFRTPLQLRSLVVAIQSAGEHDESDWIEWKSNYDLSEKSTKATLARHIIALANRTVEKSRQAAGGHGYIIVGVEPGNLEGVRTIDLADLESGVRPYLGPLGPEWIPAYISCEGKDVLAISVDPPRQGDRIHTLEKSFDKYYAGMIFVRRTAQTVLADPGEVFALSQRVQVVEDRQSLTLTSAKEVTSAPSWPWLDEALRSMLNEEREEVEAKGRRKVARQFLPAIDNDPRTLEDYTEEARQYLERYKTYLFEVAVQTFVRSGHGSLEMNLKNSQERSYQQVRVEVELPSGFAAYMAEEYAGDDIEPPNRPTPLGKQHFSVMSNEIHFGDMLSRTSGLDIDARVEEGRIIFDVASLRAEESLPLPIFHLLAPPGLNSGATRMAWSITAVNAVGRTKGTIDIKVGATVERQASDRD
ncbi:ATP-binding protein [Streptomyces sp. SYP-A7185]|uniref:ATP-binding protein n=1 Tax=Streptomyces sp. SYP-A7185 TaxID=3040076 RepID=UPI0038F747E5